MRVRCPPYSFLARARSGAAHALERHPPAHPLQIVSPTALSEVGAREEQVCARARVLVYASPPTPPFSAPCSTAAPFRPRVADLLCRHAITRAGTSTALRHSSTTAAVGRVGVSKSGETRPEEPLPDGARRVSRDWVPARAGKLGTDGRRDTESRRSGRQRVRRLRVQSHTVLRSLRCEC